MTRAPVDPFLKWVGSKRQLRATLRELLPEGARLVEPFLGSGAVFGAVDYPAYYLADKNADLIHFYQMLMYQGDLFITYCSQFFAPSFSTEDQYYDLRSTFNTTNDPWLQAALFLYINRHGYNGLWRVNKANACNVPYGHHKKPPVFPRAKLEAFQAYMNEKRPMLFASDYRDTLKQCRAGDVVYMDPPYVPASATANFTGYTSGGFTDEDQRALVEWALTLQASGVTVVISNTDNEYTRRLYKDAVVRTVNVRRSVAANGASRDTVTEVVAIYACAASAVFPSSLTLDADLSPNASGTMSA